MAARGDCRRAGQDSEPEPEPEPGPGPELGPEAGLESGEEFEIVDRSQLPSPGELRSAARARAADGWSAPILTLARRATGNLSASCGSALRAAAGLGDSGVGGERAGRPRGPAGCGCHGAGGTRPARKLDGVHLLMVPPCGRSAGRGACGRGLPSHIVFVFVNPRTAAPRSRIDFK